MHATHLASSSNLMNRLPAGDLGHITARSAVDERIGDVAHRQEVGPQASHAQFGHVGERLTNAATKQEAPQLLVQARHVAVSDKRPRVHTSVTYPVALAQCNLRIEMRRF